MSTDSASERHGEELNPYLIAQRQVDDAARFLPDLDRA